MNKFSDRISILHIFVVICIMYFGIHVIYGYFYCEYSDYVNCPGYLTDGTEEYKDEGDEE